MRTAQVIITFATVLLSQLVMAQGQGKGPPPPPGDVNVINTPDVNVANVPDVVVANSRLNPVPTAPAGERYHDTFIDFNSPNVATSDIVSNGGQLLEIQYISGSVLMQAGTTTRCNARGIRNELGQSSVVSGHILVLHFQATFPGGDSYAFAQPTELWAPDQGEIDVVCSDINGEVKNILVHISGRWRDE